MGKIFRTGAIGALLDEYERAINDLKAVIKTIPEKALPIITDPDTSDENCVSIQAILTHVVHSGYGYAISINNLNEAAMTRAPKAFHFTIQQYYEDLDKVFSVTESVLSKIDDSEIEQFDNALKITAWRQLYDIEQMMEHAIVHILRHRRQIEKIIYCFDTKLDAN